MSWIETIPYRRATGRLRALYDRIRGPNGQIDNILRLHSLRPHTLEGHMALYKAVLHHSGNRLSRRLLETLGVYVSMLNACDYCVDHHLRGLQRLLGDDEATERIRVSLETDTFTEELDDREGKALAYARKLTTTPEEIGRADLESLSAAGFDDGEILEINQVVAYFAYANRTVLGLGCTTEREILGLSPRVMDDPDSWSHE